MAFARALTSADESARWIRNVVENAKFQSIGGVGGFRRNVEREETVLGRSFVLGDGFQNFGGEDGNGPGQLGLGKFIVQELEVGMSFVVGGHGAARV